MGGFFTNCFAVINKSTKALETGYPSFNGVIYSISYDTNYIYVGGDFTGTDQGRFAVIDKTTKSIIHYNSNGIYPNLSFPTPINTIKVDSDFVYFGGNFTNPRARFIALNRSTKVSDTAFPTYDGNVSSISTDATLIYVGGNFSNTFDVISKSTKTSVRASLSYILPTAEGVRVVHNDSDNVYLGGAFTTSGFTRFSVIDKSDVTAFVSGYPSFTTGVVSAISTDSEFIYVGGDFTTPRNYFAVINKSTKALVTDFPTFSHAVSTITNDANFIYVGGAFLNSGTRYFVVIDKRTRNLIYNGTIPVSDFGNTITSLHVDNNHLYIGGTGQIFLNNRFARVPLPKREDNIPLLEGKVFSGNVLTIEADSEYTYFGGDGEAVKIFDNDGVEEILSGWGGNNNVNITSNDASFIYVGGAFTGTNQQYFAVIDKSTKALETGYPSFNAQVNSISNDASFIYVGGLFTGTNQTRFAVINKSTKSLETGYPSFNGNVSTISIDDSFIYVGGSFTGTNQERFSVINKSTKALEIGYPSFSSTVSEISNDANFIYVGGNFTGTNQERFAVIDKTTKVLVTDYPSFGSSVRSINQDASYIYVGGGSSSPGFTVIDKITKNLVTGYPSFGSGIAVSLSQDVSFIYVGGAFTGTNQTRFAVINKSTKALEIGYPSFSSSVISISLDDNFIYVGGGFTGTNQERFAVIDKATKQIISYRDPSYFYPTNSTVRNIKTDDDYLYYGGDFTYPSTSFVMFNRTDKELLLTTPTYNNSVNYILPSSDRVYVAGAFTDTNRAYFDVIDKFTFASIGGYPTFTSTLSTIQENADYIFVGGATGQLSKINKSDKSLVGNYEHYNNPITFITNDSNNIYIGGNFTNTGRAYLTIINKTTKVATTGYATIGAVVNNIAVDDTNVYAVGNFTSPTTRFFAFNKTTLVTDTGYPSYGTAVSGITLDNDNIYVGGNFTSPTTRFSVIRKSDKVDISSGYPTFNATVSTLSNDANYIYVGGNFTDATYPRFAVIDKTTKGIISAITTLAGNVVVIDNDSTMIYLGGAFNVANGSRFAVIDKTTLTTLVSGYPTFNGQVNAITQDADNIYIGGAFTDSGRAYFTVIKKSDKSVVSGYPTLTAQINTISVDDNFIYVGGSDIVSNKAYFQVIDKTTKQFVTHKDFVGAINDMQIDGNLLYVGGAFTGTGQLYFAVLNTSEAQLTLQTGYPTLSSSTQVNKIEYDDKFIYLFGTFTNPKGTTSQYGRGIAIINKTNKLISYVYPTFSNMDSNTSRSAGKVLNGKVYTQTIIENALYDIDKSNLSREGGYFPIQIPFSSNQNIFKIQRDMNYIYIAGAFNNTALPHNFVVINRGTRQIEYKFNNFNTTVVSGRQCNDITFDNDSIWTAWSLTSSTGQILGFDKATGLQITGYPSFNNIVTAIDNDDDYIYVGGNYTTPTPTRFTVVKKSDKLADTSITRPAFNGRVRSIKNDGLVTLNSTEYASGVVYVGGDFTASSPVTAYFCIFNKANGSVITGSPTFSSSVYAIAVDTDFIYVGGNFTSPTTRFAVLDKTTLASVSGYPTFNNIVWDIKVDDTFIYVVGAFTDSGRPYLTIIRKSDKAVVTGYPTLPSLALYSVA